MLFGKEKKSKELVSMEGLDDENDMNDDMMGEGVLEESRMLGKKAKRDQQSMTLLDNKMFEGGPFNDDAGDGKLFKGMFFDSKK